MGLFPPFYPRKRRSPYLYTARASFSRILHPNPSRPATRCDDGLTVIFADSALAYDCPGTAAKCNLNAFFTDSASESIPSGGKVRGRLDGNFHGFCVRLRRSGGGVRKRADRKIPLRVLHKFRCRAGACSRRPAHKFVGTGVPDGPPHQSVGAYSFSPPIKVF